MRSQLLTTASAIGAAGDAGFTGASLDQREPQTFRAGVARIAFGAGLLGELPIEHR